MELDGVSDQHIIYVGDKKRMEAKYAIALLLLSCLAGGIYAYYNNMIPGYSPYQQYPKQTGDKGTTDTGTGTPTNLELGIGTFTLKDVARNSLDISTSLTIGTNVNHNWYAFRNGAWVLVGASGGTTGTDIETEAADNGYIYVVSSIPSGQSYYTDAAETVAMNSRVVSSQFVDVTGDTIKEFAFKWNMKNIPEAASGYPSATFTGYYLADDTGSAAFPTGGKPSDITGVGTSKVTKFISWYFAMSAEKKAVAVYKIELKVNTTSAAKCKLLNMEIPNRGYVSGTAFSYEKTDSYQIWTYEIGSDLGDCDYWKLPANHNNKFDLTTSVELTLSSGDVLAWTITIYELAAGQTTVTDTDTVNTTQA